MKKLRIIMLAVMIVTTMSTNSFAINSPTENNSVDEKIMQETKEKLNAVDGIEVLEMKKIDETDYEELDLQKYMMGARSTTTLLSESFSNTYGKKYSIKKSISVVDTISPGDLIITLKNTGRNSITYTLVNGGNLGGSNTVRDTVVQPGFTATFRIYGNELKRYIYSSISGASHHMKFTLNATSHGNIISGYVKADYIK